MFIRIDIRAAVYAFAVAAAERLKLSYCQQLTGSWSNEFFKPVSQPVRIALR
jgi:hypothetical protein